MSSDPSERLLGISADEPGAQQSASSTDDDEAYERFCFLYIGVHRLAMPVDDVRAITDLPEEVTRIPRSPDPIEGVTDLRGEITVVIDPHVHFPDSGGEGAEPALLVFDRPDQPAAIAVDDVLGVESVPERNVLDESEFSDDEIRNSPLEHPLVTGIVKQEKRSRASVREAIAEQSAADASRSDAVSPIGALEDRLKDVTGGTIGSDDDVEVDEFSLEDETTAETDDHPDSEPETTVEIELTPLLDVDRLLLASGHVSDDEDSV